MNQNFNMEHEGFKDDEDIVNQITQLIIDIGDKLDENLEMNMLLERTNITTQSRLSRFLCVVKFVGSYVKSFYFKVQQDNEPEENMRWNLLSLKHRSKIEEFRKDPSKIKVGNIYFSRNAKYIIGSGSNRTQVYLGLKEDGTEVAIKRIIKNPQNDEEFENELKHLQDLNLESKNIVKYVDLAQDEDFYYLALQLCECDLEDYMKQLCVSDHEDKDAAVKKLVEDVLHGLQVLHQAKVIHRDIKPRNVLMDSGSNARLADFGISRKLEEGSCVFTARAGTRGWEAAETLGQSGNSRYKTSSDVQVAGMLLYFILSDGKHAFDVRNSKDRETNIREGNFSLDDVKDTAAKDLIMRMICREPAERLSVGEGLQHPYFWNHERKDAVLRKLGDRDEVQNYELLGKLHKLCKSENREREREEPAAEQLIDEAFRRGNIRDNKRAVILKLVGEDLAKLQHLCDTAEKYTENKSFSAWKTELSQIWPDINQKLPEDLIGLLRVLRNKLVHKREDFEERNMLNYYSDFFISLYGLAKDLSWDY